VEIRRLEPRYTNRIVLSKPNYKFDFETAKWQFNKLRKNLTPLDKALSSILLYAAPVFISSIVNDFSDTKKKQPFYLNPIFAGGLMELISGISEFDSKVVNGQRVPVRGGVAAGYMVRGLATVAMGIKPELAEWINPYWFFLSFLFSASVGRFNEDWKNGGLSKKSWTFGEGLWLDMKAMNRFPPKLWKLIKEPDIAINYFKHSKESFPKTTLRLFRDHGNEFGYACGWLGLISGFFALLGTYVKKKQAEELKAQGKKEELPKNIWDKISYGLGKIAAVLLAGSYYDRVGSAKKTGNVLAYIFNSGLVVANLSYLALLDSPKWSQIPRFISIFLSRTQSIVDKDIMRKLFKKS